MHHDPNAPTPRSIDINLLLLTMYPLWSFCVLSSDIVRAVEQRGYWREDWGETKWFLIAAGARMPTKSEIDFVKKRAPRWGVDATVANDLDIPISKISGLVLYKRPVETNPLWEYFGEPNNVGKWYGGARPNQKGPLLQWGVVRAMRFVYPLRPPFLNQGPPLPLSSYRAAGRRVLNEVRTLMRNQWYVWV